MSAAIVARSEGNPFFAEELLAAAGDQGGELPRGLRDLLLSALGQPAPESPTGRAITMEGGNEPEDHP